MSGPFIVGIVVGCIWRYYARKRRKRLTSDVLIRAKALLTPDKWRQNPPPSGNKLCAVLAIDWVTYYAPRSFRPAAQQLRDVIGQSSISNWSDSHTYDEVMAGFDAAIAAAQTAERVQS